LLGSTVSSLAPKLARITFAIGAVEPTRLFIYLFLQVLVNVISGSLTPSFTTEEVEQMGARIIFIDTPAPCYLPAYQIDPMEGVESVSTMSEGVETHGYSIFWTKLAPMGDRDLGF